MTVSRALAAPGPAPGGRWRALLAALGLVAVGLLGGCAALSGSEAPAKDNKAPAGDAFSLVTPQEFEQQSPTLGVRIEIEAPPELKALLERHLDLVRLGRIERDDVDDTEWARLIDASPLQVRELLQTEGYFAPQVRIERAPGRAIGQADRVTLTVVPGARARVARLTLEAEGELERGAAQSEPYAVAAMEQWRKSWDLPVGADFRNPSWGEAKSAALARLQHTAPPHLCPHTVYTHEAAHIHEGAAHIPEGAAHIHEGTAHIHEGAGGRAP
jgi:translocation and assembly module TamA